MALDDFTFDKESETYYRRHKLSNGQYCMIGFQRWQTDFQTIYYVVFCVADKKKHLNGYLNQTKDDRITLKSTGRCGLEALVWAYKMMREFEERVCVAPLSPVRLAVIGEDRRRSHMYERALSRRGWHKEFLYGMWTMVKEISHEKLDR